MLGETEGGGRIGLLKMAGVAGSFADGGVGLSGEEESASTAKVTLRVRRCEGVMSCEELLRRWISSSARPSRRFLLDRLMSSSEVSTTAALLGRRMDDSIEEK